MCVLAIEPKRPTSTVTEPRRARDSTSELAMAVCAPVLACTWGGSAEDSFPLLPGGSEDGPRVVRLGGSPAWP